MGNTVLNVGEKRELSGKKKEPFYKWLLILVKKYGSKDIPQPQLHLPAGRKIRAGHESAC